MKYYQKAVSTPGIPYYTYEEMQQDLAALQAEYPAFLQLHSAGKSVEGRDITEVILGNIESRFHILIQASMHAREYMNTILMMNQINDYLRQKTGKYLENNPVSDTLHLKMYMEFIHFPEIKSIFIEL